MKIYKISAGIDPKYAHIHAQMGQDLSSGGVLQVMWDDWLAKGNIIPDFIYSAYTICKKEIAEDLIEKFNGLQTMKLSWNKNPKELSAKDIGRLKWLPKESVEMLCLFTEISIPILPQSTVRYGISGRTGRSCIKEIIGGAKMHGDNIEPRKTGMGLFFSSGDVGNHDFFSPSDGSFLLCTETVKTYIEKRQYSNILFQEIGDVID